MSHKSVNMNDQFVNMGQDGDEGKEILQKMLEHDTLKDCWPNYVVKAKNLKNKQGF